MQNFNNSPVYSNAVDIDNAFNKSVSKFENSFESDYQHADKKRKTIFGKIIQAITKPLGKVGEYALLIPLSPVMGAALRHKGFTPPSNIEARAQLFYDKIVRGEKSSNFTSNLTGGAMANPFEDTDHLAADVIEQIIVFVKNQIAKKKAGAKLPPYLDAVATGGLAVQDQIQKQTTQQINQTIGEKVLSFSPYILVAVVVIIVGIIWASKK